jgi:hypothetical protein
MEKKSIGNNLVNGELKKRKNIINYPVPRAQGITRTPHINYENQSVFKLSLGGSCGKTAGKSATRIISILYQQE